MIELAELSAAGEFSVTVDFFSWRRTFETVKVISKLRLPQFESEAPPLKRVKRQQCINDQFQLLTALYDEIDEVDVRTFELANVTGTNPWEASKLAAYTHFESKGEARRSLSCRDYDRTAAADGQ